MIMCTSKAIIHRSYIESEKANTPNYFEGNP